MKPEDVFNQIAVRWSGQNNSTVFTILTVILSNLIWILLQNQVLTEKEVRAITNS
jgi:hypothetical protein